MQSRMEVSLPPEVSLVPLFQGLALMRKRGFSDAVFDLIRYVAERSAKSVERGLYHSRQEAEADLSVEIAVIARAPAAAVVSRQSQDGPYFELFVFDEERWPTH